VIKTYSPNLMVHPLMRQSPSPASPNQKGGEGEQDPEQVSKGIIDMLPRLHVLVIGPGLGRDPLMHATCGKVLAAARKAKMPVVLDADALSIVVQTPELVMGWEEAVLTPNVVEFGRLWKAMMDSPDEEAKEKKKETDKVEALSKALGGVTIVQKGAKDFISNGETTLTVDLKGGLKRSGGQGDTLTGSIATFLAWRKAYHEGLWDDDDSEKGKKGQKMDEKETLRLAAFGGASITRECSRRAFEKKGRSLQASDLTDEVHGCFLDLFGEVEGEESSKL
jgi:ATP-dependent NAD(P)H-hydrate dehydratase